MKLRDYMDVLQKIMENGGGDLEVIYAIDDEGNAFHSVFYAPSAGCYEKDYFIGVNDVDFDDNMHEVNSVCIN